MGRGVAEATLHATLEAEQERDDEFLQEISLRARTCLSTIMGYADLLAEDTGDMPEDVKPSLARIRSAADELLEVVATLEAQVDAQRKAAVLDPLTGLPNRRALDTRGAELVTTLVGQGRAVTCLVMDLDDFKHVNDTHGHKIGDVVLRIAAARCLRILRNRDFLCRTGGDEFVILLPDASINDGQVVAERIRVAIAEWMTTEVGAVRVGASLGLATSWSTATLEALIEAADNAMYVSKRGGRNQVSAAAR